MPVTFRATVAAAADATLAAAAAAGVDLCCNCNCSCNLTATGAIGRQAKLMFSVVNVVYAGLMNPAGGVYPCYHRKLQQ